MNDSQHQSYLLRLWRNNEDEDWLAALVSIPTQERRNFPNLEALFEYLKQQGTAPLPQPRNRTGSKPFPGLVKRLDVNHR